MVRRSSLEISNAHASPLANAWLRNEAGADTLALLFPGRGYRATMPLLYYSQLALQERGADVLRLDLTYDLDPAFRAATPEEQRAWIRHDALSAYNAGIAQGRYRRVVVLGKSLGTWALTDILLQRTSAPAPACVWLTPLLQDETLVAAVRQRRPPSLFVIGTEDPLYDPVLLDELGGFPGSQSVVVPGADHGLVVSGSVQATVRAMAAYLQALSAFLGGALNGG